MVLSVAAHKAGSAYAEAHSVCTGLQLCQEMTVLRRIKIVKATKCGSTSHWGATQIHMRIGSVGE